MVILSCKADMYVYVYVWEEASHALCAQWQEHDAQTKQ